MKFSVQSTQLLKLLQSVSKIINSKNARAILDNFLLRVEDGKLYITGSDSENMLTASLDVQDTDGNGMIAIGAKALIDRVKTLPAQGITFYVNEENYQIDIQYPNGHFNFNGVNGAEYPQIVQVGEEANVIDLSSDVVLKGLESTLFAVSQETIRPVMTGVYWDFHENDLTMVSSDTHKLVRYIDRTVACGEPFAFIMPSKPAAILQSLMPKEAVNLTIRASQQNAVFHFDCYELTCLFVKGKYPNYDRVIPKENPFELTVDRETFLNAARRQAISASLASSLVKVNIQPDEMLLSSQDIDYATSGEERVMCQYAGNSMIIGFNSGYLIDVLTNIPSDTIILKLSEPSRPGIFVPMTQDDNHDLLALVMPMQVNE